MPKILIIEDDEASHDPMTRLLEKRGYEVVLAINGLEGVEMAQSEHPDLILMDIYLPEMDGYEATRKIRAFPEDGDVPIIAVTAHGATEDWKKSRDAGCNDYHAKPVAISQLERQIEALLNEKQ